MFEPDELSHPYGYRRVRWSVTMTVTSSRRLDLDIVFVSNKKKNDVSIRGCCRYDSSDICLEPTVSIPTDR